MDTHEETLNKLKGAMKVGGKYTCFHIDSMMAMTHKAEIQVKEINPEHFVFVARGKRKLLMKRWESRSYQSAPLEPIDWAIFEGWDHPITCDTDRYGQGSVSIMRGNACYNFMGTPEQVRAWIEAGQLNPFFETYKALAIENQTIDNTASYVASWLQALQALKADKRLAVTAAAQAQKAADYILDNKSPESR